MPIETWTSLAVILTAMAGLYAALRRDTTSLRTELKTDISELRTELKTDIGELRTELKTDIADARTELRVNVQRLDTRLDTMDGRTHDLGNRVPDLALELRPLTQATRN